MPFFESARLSGRLVRTFLLVSVFFSALLNLCVRLWGCGMFLEGVAAFAKISWMSGILVAILISL